MRAKSKSTKIKPIPDSVEPRSTAHSHAQPFTPERKELLLKTLAEGTPLLRCCQAIGISWTTFRNHRVSDPEFNAAYLKAHECFVDAVEQKAWNMACDVGAEKPTMLIFMLKSHKPEKYRERIEHTGKDGKPIEFTTEKREDITKEILTLARAGQLPAIEGEVVKDAGKALNGNGQAATH